MKTNTTVLLLSVGLLIFFGISILFIILYTKGLSDRIAPENCPKIEAVFAAIPNVSATSLKTLYQCDGTAVPNGAAGSKICSYTGVSDLYQAVNYCNQFPNNGCSGFLYNEKEGTFSIISTGYSIVSGLKDNSLEGNVYLRQT